MDESLYKEEKDTCIERTIYIMFILIFILTFPVAIFLSLQTIQQYERGVVFRFGKVRGPLRRPGLQFVFVYTDYMKIVDLRTTTYEVPYQDILTRDSVTVTVDAVVYYNVIDPALSVISVKCYKKATHYLAATTLRNVLGMQNLSDVLQERDNIAELMKESLENAAGKWGVRVQRVEIKEVSLPVQLQRAMAAEAEATREARAKVIAAEGEMKASASLREAAQVIAESPSALQLRYLQTLCTIASEQNSTIVFPLPMDMQTPFQAPDFNR